jgi:hypothetical protein
MSDLDLTAAIEAITLDDAIDAAWLDEDFRALVQRAVGIAAPLIAAQVRELVAQEIKQVMTDPERLRPLAADAEFGTDLANDWEWCQMIARGGAR